METPTYRWGEDVEARLSKAASAVAELRRPLPPAVVGSLRRWFRIFHVFHSNAIEGNRLTLSETKAVVEDGITVAGKSFREHAEAVNLAQAVDYVTDELASGERALGEREVQEIHAIVLRGIEPLEAGRYRRIPVLITGTTYRPPEPLLVPSEMSRFGAWLSSGDPMDPVVRATIAHTWLVTIHPFVDGNGRTARMLANLVLLRAGFPIIVLRRERRGEYYAALDASHEGDLGPMLGLVLDALEETLGEYRRAHEELDRQEAAADRLAGKLAQPEPVTAGADELVWASAVEHLSEALERQAKMIIARLPEDRRANVELRVERGEEAMDVAYRRARANGPRSVVFTIRASTDVHKVEVPFTARKENANVALEFSIKQAVELGHRVYDGNTVVPHENGFSLSGPDEPHERDGLTAADLAEILWTRIIENHLTPNSPN